MLTCAVEFPILSLLEVGCDASFVLLQARDAVEAIRLRANRLKVWKMGKLLAETPEVVASLRVDGRPNEPGFCLPGSGK